MSNENKIRILYVQPGKYPEERFAMNELRTLQQLVVGDMQAVYPWSKDDVALICNDSGRSGWSAAEPFPLRIMILSWAIFFICGFSGRNFAA